MFFTFRHTHASILLNTGISYIALQYRLGHTSFSYDYGHLWTPFNGQRKTDSFLLRKSHKFFISPQKGEQIYILELIGLLKKLLIQRL